MSPASHCGLVPSPCSLGSSGSFSEHAVERYVLHFGPLNQAVQITSKFRLVIVDAPSLVDEDEERIKHGVSINDWPSIGGPIEFVKELSKVRGRFLAVVMSRPCGLSLSACRPGGCAQHFADAHSPSSTPWDGLWTRSRAWNHQIRGRTRIPEHPEPWNICVSNRANPPSSRL
jgi:hypothetical protein